MSAILVVDDDASIRRALEIQLRRDGHEVAAVASGEEAVELLSRSRVDIMLLDLRLPGMPGEEVVARARDLCPETSIIVITAHGSIESAVGTMKAGAADYLPKPFTPHEVRLRIGQVEHVRALEREVAGLRRRVGELPFGTSFLTQHAETLEMLDSARRIAPTDATVLISGESGTGKTLLARLIHDQSRRAAGPFQVVDCASIHDALLESDLFGHHRGAFTGAVEDRAGKVEAAEGGTLFLDEVGEIPIHLQGKLLRLVEDRRYCRLGETRERAADVRVIAATNRDLEELIGRAEFRADLYFRLSVVDLAILPLRARTEDVLLLAGTLLPRLATTHRRDVRSWDDEVERVLLRYPWPGNVRELVHVLERGLLLAAGRRLVLSDLPARVREPNVETGMGAGATTLAAVEEAHLRRILALDLPLERAADLLGIDVSTLRRKRRRLGL